VATSAPGQEFDFCFLGEHEYTVDSQRRVALPKAWRRDDAARNRFFLLPGREKSLQLVPGEMFQELLLKLRKVSFADAKAAIALATIGSMAQEVTCDRQGRITMTPKLMDHAGITEKALLLGAVTTVQIWEPDAWEARKMSSEAGLDVLEAIQERPDDFTEILKNAVQH
jgi:MraZ protein